MDDQENLKISLDISGRLEALLLAFVVFEKMQPAEFQRQFISAYQNEVIAWRELASATPNPDIWIERVEEHAARLVQLMAE